MEQLISIKNIKKSFKLFESFISSSSKSVNAVNNITLNINKGSAIGIVGESGSGKTTLAKIIAGILIPDEGKIYYKGTAVQKKNKLYNEYRRNIQMVFQDPYSALNPRLTIFSSLKDPIKKFITNDKNEIYAIALKYLKMVGLEEEHLNRYPHEFSGGQKQRISIARAMLTDPELIIADEPTSALDVSVQAQILNLMKEINNNSGKSIILISHDLSIVKFLCKEIVVMYKGIAVEYGNTVELINNPKHPYTVELITSSLIKENAKKQFNNIGICPYSERCDYFMEECKSTIKLQHFSDSHSMLCNKKD